MVNRPKLVHRLDRDTSGVLLMGKTPLAAARLSGAFAKRRAAKTYWAIVAGNPKPGQGFVNVPLVKTGLNDREMVLPAEPKDPRADPAETEFVTIARAGPRAAWLALRPHTGRTLVQQQSVGGPANGTAEKVQQCGSGQPRLVRERAKLQKVLVDIQQFVLIDGDGGHA